MPKAAYRGPWRNRVSLLGADDIIGYAHRMLLKERTKGREVTEFLMSVEQYERLMCPSHLFEIDVSVCALDLEE